MQQQKKSCKILGLHKSCKQKQSTPETLNYGNFEIMTSKSQVFSAL